jgi:phosphatidylinositol kinase/protein kinase (PI-3  family)
VELEFSISTHATPCAPLSSPCSATPVSPSSHHTKHLLYKHGDDLRQEMLALQFIREVDSILKSCGLDMHIKTFGCCPVASNRGFIEWMTGCVPLSKICDPDLYEYAHDFNDSLDHKKIGKPDALMLNADYLMDIATSFGSSATLPANNAPKNRGGDNQVKADKGWLKHQFLTRPITCSATKQSLASSVNPIQDFLRSSAYDSSSPFLINRNIMDTYVKSCAGFCIATYLLVRSILTQVGAVDILTFAHLSTLLRRFSQGIGDRHLDNILLSAETGQLIHCDFSFILGLDPKTYIPMR